MVESTKQEWQKKRFLNLVSPLDSDVMQVSISNLVINLFSIIATNKETRIGFGMVTCMFDIVDIII